MRQHHTLIARTVCILAMMTGYWVWTMGFALGAPSPAIASMLLFANLACGIAVLTHGLHKPLSRTYLLVFSLFHFGLLPSFIFGLDAPGILSSSWIVREPLAAAYGMSTVAFGFGCLVSTKPTNIRNGSVVSVTSNNLSSYRRIGSALIFGGSLTWFSVSVATGGFGIFGVGYINFLASTPGLPLSLAYLSLSIGTVLFLGSLDKIRLSPVMAVLIITNLVLLRVGFRGEVMMPGAAALALRAMFQNAPSAKKIAATIAGTLALIPGLAAIRLDGGLGSIAKLNPLDGLGELGFTIRPVALSIRWVGESGTRSGETYFGVLLRAMENFGLVSDPPAPVNTEVFEREGPIGFSPVAEGYLNFGSLGAVLAIGATVWALRWFEDQRHEVSHFAGALFLAVMLYQVRNSFTQVPFQLLASAASLFACQLISSRGLQGPMDEPIRNMRPQRDSRNKWPERL